MCSARPSAAVSIAFLLIAASAGCNSNQPTENETQKVVLSFDTTSHSPTWNCWDVVRISDGQPQPLLCLPSGAPLSTSRQPWAFSCEVSLIPAGQTNEKMIATTVGVAGQFPSFTNVTAPDPQLGSAPVIPPNPDPALDYTNPRQVTQGSPDYATFKHLSVPHPNVFGSPSAYEFTVHKGDTVIVRARKIERARYIPELTDPFPPDPELKLSGKLTINGAEANALGTIQTPTDDAGGLTFSYTVH